MPEDYYGEDYGIGYEAPLSYIEQMYDLPAATSDEGALPAAASPVDLGDWSLENFQKQFMQGDPAKADAINKYIAEQAAQGKEVVSMNPYQGGGLDAINANIWNRYNQFDPNDPTATTGQVFRFDTGAGYASAPAVLSKGKSYTLTDGKGQKVLGTASTPEEMQRLVDLADAQKYGWYLYETNPDGSFTPGTQLFGESDTRAGGLMGALVNIGLPLAMSFIPGVGWVGSAALAGAGSTAAGLMTGKTLGDALKSGAITAGTAGLLKGTGLDQTIGNALSDVPVVGDALRTVGNAFSPSATGSVGANAVANAAADAAANEIVVNAAKSLVPSIVSGGLSSAAANLLPNIVTNPATGELSIARQTQPEPASEPAGGLDALPAEDIVVTAGKTPLDLSGAAGGSLGAFVPQVVTNPITGETTVQRTETPQEKPVEEKFDETFAQPNDIVVTAGPDLSALNNLVSGGLSSLTPSVSTPMTPPAEGPLSQETTQNEEPGNEIVVEGDTGLNLPPLPLPPITSVDIPDLAGTVLPDVPQGPLSQEEVTQETTPTENEIVVEGDTGLNLPPLPLPPITSVDIPDLAGTVLPDVPQGPLSQETTQEEQPGNEIVVTGDTAKPIEDLISSVGAVVPPINSVDIPDNAGDVQPADEKDKGGLSTIDKLRLAMAALGAIGGGVGGGSGGGATIPSGFGRRDPIYSAKLPTPGQNGAFAVGGLGGGTLPMPAGGDLTQFGMGNATRAAPTQIPQYGGVNPPGFNTQTWDWLGPQQTVAKDIMDQLAVLPSSAAPAPAPEEPVKKAMGGYAVGGPGDGRSDEIPALLSDGEYVIDAETVALLGNGSSKAGAQQLDKFRANIRKHKGRQLARGKFSVKAKQPSAYLSGGR